VNRDEEWLRESIEHSRLCLPSLAAYSVGAIIVSSAGTELARGYSRETAATAHAEEAALARVRSNDLVGATLYSSLEPCGVRTSRPVPCARLIAETAISRVVFALREPPTLAPGGGAAMLRAAGVEVVEVQGFSDEVRAVNAHLFRDARR
jgi:diaminohydroxyphosphoribosylaminopyrimidine deaminase / 5-amino-6-(5-phosphoribosylamino)uracil reductase